MNQEDIEKKAQALADQHKRDMITAREDLVKQAIEKGYSPEEWVICDNSEDIKAGLTLEYHCWLSKKNPTKL